MADVVIHGLRELALNLDQFPEKLQRKALAASLRAAGRVIRDRARAAVPVRSGKLRRSIRVTIVRKSGRITARIVAGRRVKRDDPWYAWFVEGGTKPHRIAAKLKGSLSIGGGIWLDKVDHPGAQAKPFLGPALEAGAEDALRVMRDALAAEIEGLGGLA